MCETVTWTKQIFLYLCLKVCLNLSDQHVIITETPSGLSCKLYCPECTYPIKLSSCVNDLTGKCSFSIYNFSRHYTKHQKSMNFLGDNQYFVDSLSQKAAETRYEQLAMNEVDDHDSDVCLNGTQYSVNMDLTMPSTDKSSPNEPHSIPCTECIKLKQEIELKDKFLLEYQGRLKNANEIQEKSCQIIENKMPTPCDDCNGLQKQIDECTTKFNDCNERLINSINFCRKKNCELKEKGKLQHF